MKAATNLFALALAGAVLLGAPAAIAQTFEMKIAGTAIGDPNHGYMVEFARRIEAETKGKIVGKVFPAGQLGGGPRLIEGLQLGTVELVILPPAFFKAVSPVFEVTDAPGVLKNLQHAQKVLTDPEFSGPFLKAAEDRGLVGVSLYAYDGSSYASTEPLRTLADFKGKKFRVLATKTEMQLMQSIGASGVPIDFSEVIPALQRKTVDGVRSSKVIMGGGKYFTVTKYVTEVLDAQIPTAAFVSKIFMDRLPPDLRQAVFKVGKEMDTWTYQQVLEAHKKSDQIWKEGGAEIIHLSPADQAEFIKRAQAVGEDVFGKATDPKVKSMYELLKKVAAKHQG
jgi:C4-dicarboxylate-binding protein DctP